MSTQNSTNPVLITTAEVAPDLAFTRRKVEDFVSLLTSRGVEVTPEAEERILGEGPPWYAFPCPGCRKPLLIYGMDAVDMDGGEPGLLGFAEFMHEDEATQCGRSAPNFTEAILARYGVKAPAGVNLELAVLREEMGGGQPDWLIPNIMEAGLMAALYGPAGTGKSLLALEWAVQVALAGKRVVYLDEENPERVYRKRLKKMGVSMAALMAQRDGGQAMTYHSFTNWNVDTEEGAAAIVEACQGADLVVFDSWNKFFASGSQAQDGPALAAYRLVVKPLRAAGVGILRLDHTGHTDLTRPLGTVVKLGDVDHNWQVAARERRNGQTALTLTSHKTRNDSTPDALELIREWDPVLRHISATDRPVEEAVDAPSDPVERLMAEMAVRTYPADWSNRKCGKALREAGVQVNNDDLAEAVRRRKAAWARTAREG